MTISNNAVPLSRSADIPFNKLVLSQSNVRQIKAGLSVDELSEDIGLRGLVQSLNIRPILDGDGNETGKYEVPAGGRRFRALELLVKAKRMRKDALVPCVIKDRSVTTSSEDDSLAENTHRQPLHPLDQYRAFLTLRRQNMSEEDIAARYFVSVTVVKQRLRLAAVSPLLLDLYAADELTLEQLMAFSVTGDHQRQEDVWNQIKDGPTWQRDPYHLRRHLTEASVPATDRRARFVGIEAYQAAGGEVLTDLFSADDGGRFQDSGLLDRLVAEKLGAIAQGLQGDGWKWIEVLASLPFNHMDGLRRLTLAGPALSEEDQFALDALKAEVSAIEQAFEEYEDYPEEADLRLGELETAIEALEGSYEPSFDPAEIGRAGVIVSLDRNGEAMILKGYVRPEDEISPEGEATQGDGEVPTSSGETPVIILGTPTSKPEPAPEEAEGDAIRPLPERLVLELTTFGTVALRDAIARNPRVAMTALLHKLVGDTFQQRHSGACFQVAVLPPQLVGKAQKDLDETVPAASMARRKELWAEVLPHDDQALWDWLQGESEEVRADLLAFCVSFGINALTERADAYGAGASQYALDCRQRQAVRIAQATDLDLVALGWRPTAETYLNRVPRVRILEAVREACGERTAQMMDHLKKGDMVTEAERLLADTGWLPEPLRALNADKIESPQAQDEALPSFLSDLGDGADTDTPVAAE
ncbi:ParB N-terminal domain-containing protein (plasmid) [Asticcacaulis sp. DW145]|uniref:ParB/RepB/Spo0J family partition protein n=1 Tax=Asticcacaulis sp. DW145 TaxID=3095608 RepID=UPI0030874B1B|nr:ParB N-terminal domain-containing protein [Asticcacaulis sp. DW145]